MNLAQQVGEHKADESQDMKRLNGCGQAFVVFSQAAKACDPGKGTLHHPTLRQQHKALFCFRDFNHFEPHVVVTSILFWFWATVASIHKGHLDAVSRHFLHGIAQCFNLGAVVLIGRRDTQGQQVPQRIYRRMNLGAALALMAVAKSPPVESAALFVKSTP